MDPGVGSHGLYVPNWVGEAQFFTLKLEGKHFHSGGMNLEGGNLELSMAIFFQLTGEYLCAREKKENDIKGKQKHEPEIWCLTPPGCSLVVRAHKMSFLLCLVWVRFLSLTEEAKILHYIHKHKKSGVDMRGLSFQVLAYYTRKLKGNCDLTYA